MTTNTARHPDPAWSGRQTLNKVPEVTIWFWIIKILCTTVGESFADWMNMGLGFGLNATAAVFTGALILVLGSQFRLSRYVPVVYWLAVVVVSITGTLYTDILTDELGVPLRSSSAVFTCVLAMVFGVWYARERTLSIHSIVTLPREGFYWLAVVVTFALGTAVGDWTLELTGWSAGTSVLLPAGLIAAVTLGWRAGGEAVLCFWLAYILTRPLGANLGDWFAGYLGTAVTSSLFLVLIAAAVGYLTLSKADVEVDTRARPTLSSVRRRTVLTGFALVAIATGMLLRLTSQLPHAAGSEVENESGGNAPAVAAPPAPVPAPAAGTAPATRFSDAELAPFKRIASDDLALLESGNQDRATNRITDLETAWDEAQHRLQAEDPQGWALLDARIDVVLHQLRARTPDLSGEKIALNNLLAMIG